MRPPYGEQSSFPKRLQPEQSEVVQALVSGQTGGLTHNQGEDVMKKLLIAAAMIAGTATPALAQQSGLVNVDVSNVLNNLDLDLLNNSLNNNTVQVPIGVAANVCGVDANVLASQRKSDSPVNCAATTTSQALKQAAKKQAVPKAQ